MTKKIGLLFGMERSFPGALAEEINRIGGGKVGAEPVDMAAIQWHHLFFTPTRSRRTT